MNRRGGLLAVGLAAVVAGVALTLRPGLVSFDFATLLTLGIWAVALVGVALAAVQRFDGEDDSTGALPRAGERPDYAVPGDDLAAAVGAVGASERDAAERDRIRERLRATAVEALERFEGDSPAEADARLAEGAWTGDPDAAALFADDGDAGIHADVDPDFDRRAERAAAAIARLGDEGGRDAEVRRAGGAADD
ncbi:hypothetical protein ACFQMA_21590 [Halosimplex aquaticum]|uniref:Uncharacterized protein n=1 Tax=Halosimplex aquaticum TaxID=3026162 RepID=A0ABD5Y4W0_9EURY|nr:hypothetical protein [Halosimplex aquaticum]